MFGIFFIFILMKNIGTQHKKISLKQKLNLAISTTIVYAVLLFALQYILQFEKQDIGSIVLQSILFGFVFVFANTYLFNRNSESITNFFSKNTDAITSDQEEIIAGGPANLFRGIGAVGGKLFLTKEGLVFNSHKFNIQRGQTKISYSAIEKIEPFNYTKIIRFENGLKVHTKEGKTYKFVVNEREIWIKNIEEQLQEAKTAN